MRLAKIPGMMRLSLGLPWLCGVHVRCADPPAYRSPYSSTTAAGSLTVKVVP